MTDIRCQLCGDRLLGCEFLRIIHLEPLSTSITPLRMLFNNPPVHISDLGLINIWFLPMKPRPALAANY